MSLVAIVGRPNVGKSTLFNRLVGMRQAIVDDEAGVTRDRHYGRCEWCGREFSVVDTGGYTSSSEDVFESAIRSQVKIAIEEADLVLFMVEAATGVTDYDAEIADILRRSGKKVILCVNKVDSGEKMFDVYQFYSLGLGELFSVSAANDLPIYTPGGKEGNSDQYILDFISIQDGWYRDFYYYSPAPYQRYTLWSAGPNGRTFPPWISRARLNSRANECVVKWTTDDIIHMSN